MKENKQQQKNHKAIFIARATRHFDTPEIRKEASEMWDDKNGVKKKKMSIAKKIFKRFF
mgnify:CR=1 FL=1